MGTELVPLSHFATHKRVWRRLVQTARLCCGIPDYDNYVRHVLEKHPDREPMDYKTFFRERQEARAEQRHGLCERGHRPDAHGITTRAQDGSSPATPHAWPAA